MSDIIIQGTELMQDLHKQEDEYAAQHTADDDEEGFGQGDDQGSDEVIIITEYYDDYYDPYYDPFYISPAWMCLLLL